jgi:hypothetical protein
VSFKVRRKREGVLGDKGKNKDKDKNGGVINKGVIDKVGRTD